MFFLKEIFLIFMVVISVGVFGMTIRFLISIAKKKRLDFRELISSFFTSTFTALLMVIIYFLFDF